MNFSAILDALNQASAFELYRLSLAIRTKLDDPRWRLAVQQRVLIGQEVQWFNSRENRLRRGKLLEKRQRTVLLLDTEDGRRWELDYFCINLEGVDVQVREQRPRGLGRNEVAIGQTLGYIDRNGNERSGAVLRRNQKTVTMQVGDKQWLVSYEFLHHVLDGEARSARDLPTIAP